MVFNIGVECAFPFGEISLLENSIINPSRTVNPAQRSMRYQPRGDQLFQFIENKKVLGEAPWKYEVLSGEQTFIQPQWNWGKNFLKVVDVEFAENLEVSW